jgi:hypothetical protein
LFIIIKAPEILRRVFGLRHSKIPPHSSFLYKVVWTLAKYVNILSVKHIYTVHSCTQTFVTCM